MPPFGEVQVSKKTLLTYANFHYNINTELVHKIEANGGTITQAGSTEILQTGANIAGTGGFASRLPARYIPGQGMMIIFSFPDDIILAPSEAILITAESTANSDIAVGLSWKELL